MKRVVAIVLAVMAGAVIGGLAAGVAQREPDPFARPTAADPTSTVARAAGPPAAEGVLLVWTQGGFPAGFTARVAELDGISRVSVVRAGMAGLTGSEDADGAVVDLTRPGFMIPLDVLAFDPATYPDLFPKQSLLALRQLGPDEALLSTTSATLRRLSPGGVLELTGGTRLTVAGVVDDELVGGAEVALSTAGGQAVGVTLERAVLVEYDGGRAQLERALRAAAGSQPLRFRGPGETPYLRPGDGVLPQALIKERFGEFSYRPGTGREFTQDPAFTSKHLVVAQLPVLGQVRCHRSILPALESALRELVQRNLASLLDPAGFQGCWNPRLIAVGAGVSRHAWGVAVDVNWTGNRTGLGSSQDPRLVEVMERWGFSWGGRWLVPDPAHFEYLRPPRV